MKWRLASPAWAMLLLSAAVLLLYGRTIGFQYVFDDTEIFFSTLRAYAQHGQPTWVELGKPFLSMAYFRPLALWCFFQEATLSGWNPAASHAVNLLFFLMNALLVFLLAKKLMQSQESRPANCVLPALLAALAYIVHPALTESTAWISGRFDLMATCFMLLASCLFLSGWRGWIRLPLIGACALAALLSKELGAVLPAVLLCLWLALHAKEERNWKSLCALAFRENWRLWLVFAAVAALYFALRHAAHVGPYLPRAQAAFYTSIGSRLFYALETLKFYSLEVFFPFGLVDIKHPVNEMVFPWTAKDIAGNLATLALWGFALSMAAKKRSSCAWLSFAGLACLAPVLNLVPLSLNSNLAQDRFLTAPLAFWCAMLAVFPYGKLAASPFFQKLAGSMPNLPLPRLLGFLAFCWLAGAAWTTASILPLWQNNLFLWKSAAIRHPKDVESRQGYLLALLVFGQDKLRDQELAKFLHDFKSSQLNEYQKVLVGMLLTMKNDPRGLGYFQDLVDHMPKFRAPFSGNASINDTKQFVLLYAFYSEAIFRFQKNPALALQMLAVAEDAAQKGLPGESDTQQQFFARKLACLYALGRFSEADALRRSKAGDANLQQSASTVLPALLSAYCEGAPKPYCRQIEAMGLAKLPD